jgi:hypothetical protein
MDEEEVGDSAKAMDRFLVVDTDGFLREIPTRGNYRESQLSHQQVMQGRIGQQNPERRVSRSYALGNLSAFPLLPEN